MNQRTWTGLCTALDTDSGVVKAGEEEVKGWERGDICNTVHMRKKPCSRFFQLFLLACRVSRLQLSTAPPAPPRPFRNFRVRAPGCHSELVPSAALFAQQASAVLRVGPGPRGQARTP